jgi:hypothetical protein
MSKAKDFSEDLAIVSKSVATDVDTIVKIVRQKDAGEGEKQHPLSVDEEPAHDAPDAVSPAPQPASSQQRTLRPRKSNVAVPPEGIPLDNVTTRLRRDTNERLTEAALHQKLKKERPNTRQDIIQDALQEWLRRHGYLATFTNRD